MRNVEFTTTKKKEKDKTYEKTLLESLDLADLKTKLVIRREKALQTVNFYFLFYTAIYLKH